MDKQNYSPQLAAANKLLYQLRKQVQKQKTGKKRSHIKRPSSAIPRREGSYAH